MQPYVTPERFRAMGFGVKLDAYDDDGVLRSLLSRASARVDAALKVPMGPQRHDMRGGTIVGEKQTYKVPRSDMEAPPRSLRVRHSPIRSVSRVFIALTNTQGVEFDESQLFVKPPSTIQIVSLALTPNSIFGNALLPIIGLSDPIASIDYTYGYDFEAVDDILDPWDGMRFRAQHQWWDKTQPVTVKVDGVEVLTGFVIDHNEGTITFDANQAAGALVTASYHHRLPYEVAQAVGITAAEMVGQEDLAAIGMVGLRRLKIAEIEVERDTGMGRSGSSREIPALPPAAENLLMGLDFISVR